ncbi:hypothetical protein Aros01_08033 [Streptosporangium roseum]|uniref:RCC1 domain-containing protein n=1 Tax=Streptosporangium roseum TaxID=2001 RepID=UPI0030A9351C
MHHLLGADHHARIRYPASADRESVRQVQAWGDDAFGQLGQSIPGDRSLPAAVTGFSGGEVMDLAAGGNHSLALLEGGVLTGWGLDSDGRLGDGSLTNRAAPVIVRIDRERFQIVEAGRAHSLAA